jgi:hypothetical protein
MINNYLLAPPLDGDYATPDNGGADNYLLLGIFFQLVGMVILVLLLSFVKKIVNTSVVDHFQKQVNADRRIKNTIHPAFLYSGLMAVFAMVIVAVVYGITWFQPHGTSGSEAKQGGYPANEIAALSCTTLIGNSGASYSNDLGGHWSKNSPNHIDANGIDVQNCNLVEALTDRQNFIAVIGASSEDGGGDESARLGEERAKSLAFAILSKSPGWRGRSIVVNFGKAMPQGAHISADDHYSYQRPVIVVTGYIPVARQVTTGESAPNVWEQDFEANPSIPDAAAAYAAALNVIVRIPPKPLFATAGCTYSEVKITGGALDTGSRYKCSLPEM